MGREMYDHSAYFIALKSDISYHMASNACCLNYISD